MDKTATKVLARKCNNKMLLCEVTDKDGKSDYVVRIDTGKNYWWIKFDKLKKDVEDFSEFLNIKK